MFLFHFLQLVWHKILAGHTHWTHWGLNLGPSALEADVIPLHNVPIVMRLVFWMCTVAAPGLLVGCVCSLFNINLGMLMQLFIFYAKIWSVWNCQRGQTCKLKNKSDWNNLNIVYSGSNVGPNLDWACLRKQIQRSKSSGTWCSGITSASHAEGPGFNPQWGLRSVPRALPKLDLTPGRTRSNSAFPNSAQTSAA